MRDYSEWISSFFFRSLLSFFSSAAASYLYISFLVCAQFTGSIHSHWRTNRWISDAHQLSNSWCWPLYLYAGIGNFKSKSRFIKIHTLESMILRLRHFSIFSFVCLGLEHTTICVCACVSAEAALQKYKFHQMWFDFLYFRFVNCMIDCIV